MAVALNSSQRPRGLMITIDNSSLTRDENQEIIDQDEFQQKRYEYLGVEIDSIHISSAFLKEILNGVHDGKHEALAAKIRELLTSEDAPMITFAFHSQNLVKDNENKP